jgi:hypothetical protein
MECESKSNSIAERTRGDTFSALTIEVVQVILVVIDNGCIAVRRRAVPGLGPGMRAFELSVEGFEDAITTSGWRELMVLSVCWPHGYAMGGL